MPELHVSKKNIGKLFGEMQNRKFVIPDFQRPYKWDIEKCETLWEDIVSYMKTEAEKGDYFLGTIVTSANDEKNLNIIDGQQRVTSFFLMLRAFYKKLEDMYEDDDVKGLKSQLGPCIWDVNSISQKVTDQTKIHIESRVATEEDNEVFHQILETGEVPIGNSANYSLNYNYFKTQCDSFAQENPLQWKELCVTILNKCIVLPIECETEETALTIFSTLNDRGMPLSDSDIFKARIYSNKDTMVERTEFTQAWKNLAQICTQAKISIDDVFRYYTHVLRARDGDKSKEMGLRKFYSLNNYEKLKQEGIMPEIMALAYFWRYLNTEIEPDDETNYIISIEARKYVHCLNYYPNDFWKYATSVFFIKNSDSDSFSELFVIFLKELTAFLFAKFIEYPSVNAIKNDIYNSCVSIMASNTLSYKYKLDTKKLYADLNQHHSSRLSRALLLLHAYLYKGQNDLIQDNFDVEHIFPKKWQNTNYNGWLREDAIEYLDRLGNKVIFEKRLNIQAGNGYFGQKKIKYEASKISEVNYLSAYEKNDWLKVDIEKRELKLKMRLNRFLSNTLKD